jgi:hypothetical protein
VNFESLIKEHHLVVDTKILMALAKGIKDGRGSIEMRDHLVVCMRDIIQHEWSQSVNPFSSTMSIK